MKILILVIVGFVLSFYLGCCYEKNVMQRQMAEKQEEVVRHAAQKRAKIQAQPNATRDELLRLMRAGEL